MSQTTPSHTGCGCRSASEPDRSQPTGADGPQGGGPAPDPVAIAAAVTGVLGSSGPAQSTARGDEGVPEGHKPGNLLGLRDVSASGSGGGCGCKGH